MPTADQFIISSVNYWPGDISIEQPTEFDFNLATTKALGPAIPQALAW